MSYVRIKSGAYIAIINENIMIEVHADSSEKAKEIAGNIYDGDITVCKIPSTIGYVG